LAVQVYLDDDVEVLPEFLPSTHYDWIGFVIKTALQYGAKKIIRYIYGNRYINYNYISASDKTEITRGIVLCGLEIFKLIYHHNPDIHDRQKLVHCSYTSLKFDVEIIEYLLEIGVLTEVISNAELRGTSWFDCDFYGTYTYHKSAIRNMSAKALSILLDLQKEELSQYRLMVLLRLAIDVGNLDVVKVLTEKTSVAITCPGKLSPLTHARNQGSNRLEIVEYLEREEKQRKRTQRRINRHKKEHGCNVIVYG
jgi:hypothetical protein